MRITGKTRLCAVIGDPVEHSLSPTIQNAAFNYLGLDYVYVAFRVRLEDLERAMLGMKVLGIYGMNVTMPHKIGVIKYLDELDESARNVGAVNTILNRDGHLIGYNTDGIGALEALKAIDRDLIKRKVVIIGAGGASRAISFTLAREVAKLTILNRTLKRAERLANEIRRVSGVDVRFGGFTYESLSKELEDADIVINATPIGMHPNEEETPIDKHLLRPDLIVFDLVYNPLETRLLREAREAGAKTIDGLEMLIYQGAASFEIWTGMKAPVEIMMESAREELARRGIRWR